MKNFYHATSYFNAQNIITNGFKPGQKGMFGPAIYFAMDPKDSIKKAQSSILDSIIVVHLNTGRIKTEEFAHNNWNLSIINNLGYDSVQMIHCKTGPEICVYEPNRIEIIGFVFWNNKIIEIKELNNNKIDLNNFHFLLTNERRILNIKQNSIQDHIHNFDERGFCVSCGNSKCLFNRKHEFDARGHCKLCNEVSCNFGKPHKFDYTETCIICGEPSCRLGKSHLFDDRGYCMLQKENHKFDYKGYCKLCGTSNKNCNIYQTYDTEEEIKKTQSEPCLKDKNHEINQNGYCKNCRKPSCKCGKPHEFNKFGFCVFCNEPSCELGMPHEFPNYHICKMRGVSDCYLGKYHFFNKFGICSLCKKPACKTGKPHEFECNGMYRLCGFKL